LRHKLVRNKLVPDLVMVKKK